MKTHKTRHLFYRKYPYKVELKCHGIDVLGKHGVDETIRFCNDTHLSWRYLDFKQPEKDALLELANMAGDYLDRNLRTRIEGDTLNFYLEDYDLYKEIYTHFGKFVYSKTEPNSEEDKALLFSKNFIVVCDKIPHGKYSFKVILNPANITHDKRKKMLDWLKRYDDVYYICSHTSEWFNGKRGYINDPYIYVESSKHLVMLQLYMGSIIRRTYEFVLRDTAINTVSEDKLCQP